MAWNPAIVSLFEKYGYAVRQNDPDASRQNCPAEVSHRYIVESSRSLMEGHPFPLKLCPYDLSHYIKFHGMVPHDES